MKKDKSSIQNIFFNKLFYIVFLSIGLWCSVWIYDEYVTFKLESDSLRLNYVEFQKKMIQNQVGGVVKFIRDRQKQSEKKLELELKDRVYQAHGIATNIYQQNTDLKSFFEIKKMIKDALRPIRFNGSCGYYFAVSMDGVEQLYPVRPELEGENIISMQDSKGSFVIQEEIKIIKSQHEGFAKQFWTKSGKNPAVMYPRISFVKYFKPLNWYFGAGVCLDEAKEQIQKEILNYIAELRFGSQGYFFGSTYQGDPLFSNGKITLGSGSIWDLTDPNGVKIIQEQRKAVEKSDGGFVYYSWNKLKQSVPTPKISFVQGIPDWGWTIGAGVYLDSIEETISKNKAVLTRELKKRTYHSLLVLIGLLCLVYLWSRRVSDQIQKSLKIFSSSLKKTGTDIIFVNPDEIQLSEFKGIAKLINKMQQDQEKTGTALQESEDRYRSIFENAIEGFYQSTPQGRFITVNPAFSKMLGYESPKELIADISDIGKQCYVDQEDRSRYVQLLKQGKSIENFEFRVRRKDGLHIWVSSNGRAIYDQKGEISFYQGNAVDITEKKKAETALMDSEKQFRDLFNAITDLVYTQDLEGHFISVNPSMQKLFGYEMHEFIGHKASDFMEKEFQAGFTTRYLEVIKKQKYHEGTSYYYKKDGRKIYIEYKSFLVEPDDGSEPYISGIGRDVTEKILSVKKIKKLQEQIVQSQKMESIGTLAGGIAHDFNNILFPILGHTEMLLEDVPEDSPFRNGLNGIYTGALRAKELVKQILTFSRQDNNELKLMKIQHIVKEALKLIRSTTPATIQIQQNIQGDCGVIKADPTQIHQIIMNLTTNACHAMDESGGEMKISLKEISFSEKDLIMPDMKSCVYACLTVSDTGKGMDKNLIEKIFDPFFTTKEKGKGTGMGLSVVHGIVSKLGGLIQVNSKPGKGTRIHIYLPIIENLSEIKPGHEKGSVMSGIENVLLVDDEEEILKMEKQMLERLGYEVTSRISSLEALNAFRASPDKFDLVITDMAMPNMPGDKLSAELVKIRPDIPILLCTGFSESLSEENAASMGIQGFLLKPIIMKELSRKIREVLDKTR